MNKKKNDVEETVFYNNIGEEIHVFKGPNGIVPVKNIDTSVWLPTGEEYCPDCHRLMTHKDGYWDCDICKYSITDEESEYGEGHPSLESTYEDDYGEYYDDEDDDPEWL